MPLLAITSIGVDRPGIVAAVTKVLLDGGCNLEDTAMSILRGQFAMVMVVDAPDGTTAAGLEAALARDTEAFDLVITARELHGPLGDADGGGEVWTLVVYGRDHPGIVHFVSSELANLSVNIVDVTTRVTPAPEGHLYTMVTEVHVPSTTTAAAIEEALRSAPGGEGLTFRLHPSDADVL